MLPIYTADNCRPAYQLNWSLSVFASTEFPDSSVWLERLRTLVEPDGVRILEFRALQPHVVQFLVSSTPMVAPAEIIRSIKGRCQNLLNATHPSMFRRNYRIDTVGDANCEQLDRYVAGQTDKHPMADHRIQDILESLQFHDPKVDLSAVQTSSFGQYVNGLQIVIENEGSWNEVRNHILLGMRQMIIRASQQKSWRLLRIGLLSNHIHILLGAGMNESPQQIALSLLNNLAFVHEMKPVFRFSYYVGTFGKYDRWAIRANL